MALFMFSSIKSADDWMARSQHSWIGLLARRSVFFADFPNQILNKLRNFLFHIVRMAKDLLDCPFSFNNILSDVLDPFEEFAAEGKARFAGLDLVLGRQLHHPKHARATDPATIDKVIPVSGTMVGWEVVFVLGQVIPPDNSPVLWLGLWIGLDQISGFFPGIGLVSGVHLAPVGITNQKRRLASVGCLHADG